MPKWKILSGSSLKIIAIVSMLIDHICKLMINTNIIADKVLTNNIYFYGSFIVGRLAFPIFCFLLVEGSHYTKNIKKYLIRLGAFALISEIPYDLFFSNKMFNWSDNNIFFTLFIGLIVLILIKKANNIYLACLITLIGSVIAELLGFSYGASGIILIVSLYFAKQNPTNLLIAGGIFFMLNPYVNFGAILAFLIMNFYNKKRGLNIKYLFYIFYPLHLILLYLFK